MILGERTWETGEEVQVWNQCELVRPCLKNKAKNQISNLYTEENRKCKYLRDLITASFHKPQGGFPAYLSPT